MRQARALGSVAGSAMINAAVAAVVGIATARFLGPSGQGTFSVVVTTAAIVMLAMTLGTGTFLRVRARAQPSRDDLAAYLGVSAPLAALSGSIGALAVLLVLGGDLSPQQYGLVWVYSALLLIGRQSADLLQAHGLVSSSILSQGIASAAQLSSFAVATATVGPSVTIALLAAAIGPVAQMFFAVSTLHRRGHLLTKPQLRGAINLIRGGVPSLGYSLGLLVMQRTDRLMLAAMAGPHVTGLYTAAATLAEAVRLVPASTGQLMFARTAEAGRVDGSTRRLYRLQNLVLLATLVMLFALAPLIPNLLGEAYRDSITLFRGLLIAELFMGLALMDSRIIMGLGRLKAIGGITVMLIVVAIPSYTLAINAKQAWGAVVASILLYALYAVVLRVYRARVGPPGKHLRTNRTSQRMQA